MIRSILVPTDGSGFANKAVEMACDLADKYGARILFLHVITGEKVPALAHFAEIEHIKESEVPRAIADRLLDTAESTARKAGLTDIERMVRDGDPAKEVLDVAKGDDVDLIVMGSRGLGALKELMIGSVSHKVSQLAPCATITVR